ncbi:MAG: hypothetical protein GY847_14440 [Proteobacteria bacterium]|nr:hypothetical protein [Pseudomonadota bacterium]
MTIKIKHVCETCGNDIEGECCIDWHVIGGGECKRWEPGFIIATEADIDRLCYKVKDEKTPT